MNKLIGMDNNPAIKVNGQQWLELPQDLYIPPESLKIFLETFEGPLDLLLYLIKKDNFDILNIPIAEITRQYMKYIELMQVLELELAAEYLLMAAMLAEIKSRLLLPKPAAAEEMDEADPRAELVRRLQEYERYQRAAQDLDSLPRVEREIYTAQAEPPQMDIAPIKPAITLIEIQRAFQEVLNRAKLYSKHQISVETLSIRERMVEVLNKIDGLQFMEFKHFFRVNEGAMGVVVTLIAILELVRQSVIELVQSDTYNPIYIKRKNSS